MVKKAEESNMVREVGNIKKAELELLELKGRVSEMKNTLNGVNIKLALN